jgi:PAS domain S-box-containing protein
MTVELEQNGIRQAFALFEIAMVFICLFSTILESGRQRKGEYAALTWGLALYFFGLLIEVLGDPTITPLLVGAPILRVLALSLESAGFLVLSNALVTQRLIERAQFVKILRTLGIILMVCFVIFGAVSMNREAGYKLFWHPPFSAGEPRGVFAGEWFFAILETAVLVYALVTMVTHVKTSSFYAQGFFALTAFARLAFLMRLVAESVTGSGSTVVVTVESLSDPMGFLFLWMAINRFIAEDLQKLNLQLMRRTELLEDATRSLTKLNQLSTNLLKTINISDITETILAGLADEFGLVHTFLLLLDKQANMLRGIRLDSNGRGYHFLDIDMRQDHFLRAAMLKGKPLFFGERSRMPDREFLSNYTLSKNLVTVPLLTKKETSCYEMYDCDKVSCPIQAFGWNTCWLCKEECPFYRDVNTQNILACVQCKAFNLIGLLVIDNRNPHHKVDEANLAFLETFANQAGMSLHNAMLVDDLSREVTFRERTFKSMPSGVMVLDEKGLIRSLNPSLLSILGMTDADVTGIPFEAVRLVNDEERFHRLVNQVLSEGRGYEGIGESWTLTLSGRTLKLNIKVNPLPGSGKRFGAVILFEDITEVSALQEQLFRSEKLATIGQMAAGIAHEVNNPLAGVSGFLQVMAARLPEDSPERSAMQAALHNINRASGTIKDLLKFARLGPANKRPIALNEIIEESLVFVQFQKEQRGVEIRREFQKDMPMVVVDPDQLRQVFTNLVLNAVQAMGDDGVLTVTTSAVNGHARVYVEDNGVGIPMADFESIFEPWFTTKQAKGTGLGLTNSDRIVTEHNGTLAFSSVEGQGTTFIVDLPLDET